LNYLKAIKKPVFSLAPMEDVTETVFREIVLSVSDPDSLQLLYTEFTSTDGLCHEKGRENVISRLLINDSERILLKKKGVAIVAQIWGSNPENFYKSAKLISEMEFDGIDINMGCPIKKIVKQGGCSALISQPELAKEIIAATKGGTGLPVSIKTRIGINKPATETWIAALLESGIAALTVHGRTQKQQSEGMADWNEIHKSVLLKDQISPETLIFGNGDVFSFQDGMEKVKNFGVDGIMIGRGIFTNPWFFNKKEIVRTPEERIALLWKHVKLFHQTWKDKKNFAILKRFFKIYINNFAGAADLRAKLMTTNSLDEVRKALQEFGFVTEKD